MRNPWLIVDKLLVVPRCRLCIRKVEVVLWLEEDHRCKVNRLWMDLLWEGLLLMEVLCNKVLLCRLGITIWTHLIKMSLLSLDCQLSQNCKFMEVLHGCKRLMEGEVPLQSASSILYLIIKSKQWLEVLCTHQELQQVLFWMLATLLSVEPVVEICVSNGIKYLFK